MPQKQVRDSTREFERARVPSQKKPYVLRLYVTGTTPQSARAIANIKKLCEIHLKGRYELDVVDLYQQPQLEIKLVLCRYTCQYIRRRAIRNFSTE